MHISYPVDVKFKQTMRDHPIFQMNYLVKERLGKTLTQRELTLLVVNRKHLL
jgi:hypothetical protein